MVKVSFCVKNFICRLSVIKLQSCIVLFINFWNLSVGSLVDVLKLLAIRKECTFLEYSFEFIITIFLPLSACVTVVFPVVNILLSSFIIRSAKQKFVMQNKQNRYINTRTSKQNCIRIMHPSGIVKAVGSNN